MPNWCEGTLKIRGTRENIKNFFLKGIWIVDFLGCKTGNLNINEHGYITYNKEFAYIVGTRRGFATYIDVDLNQEGTFIVCIDVKFAWAINANELAEISKKYNLDFKIYAFERGMEFNQDIEIVDGEIIKDNEITFDDYQWECINPILGG